MALPKIDTPVFNLTLPFSEKKLKYRPFTVKEEKILLFGQQSRDLSQIADSVKQVVQNCVMNDIDILYDDISGLTNLLRNEVLIDEGDPVLPEKAFVFSA